MSSFLSNHPDSAIQAAQHHSEGKSLVVVRVAKNDPTGLATALDAGASAIVMPHTETAEEVREMIREVYYRKSQTQQNPAGGPSNTPRQPPSASALSAPGPSSPASTTPRCTRTTPST